MEPISHCLRFKALNTRVPVAKAFLFFFFFFFFFNDTATTEIYTLSLHDALPISYIPPLTRGFASKIRLNTPVDSVVRDQIGVTIHFTGKTERFDQVIFACHSDQALQLLQDSSATEQSVLSNLAYQANEVILHTDESLLPKRKSAWASWNYWLEGNQSEESRPPTLTYNMNILQHIKAPKAFCVSLNSSERIRQDKVLRRFVYHHPVFNQQSIKAQSRRDEINGMSRTWFCGAYWYNGFHEDGVRSALDIVRGINLLDTRFSSQGAA